MKRSLIVLLIAVLLIVGYAAGPWTLMFIYSVFEKNPPKPEYTYGEFPFYLEYEINGQRMIVEDTVIVKFDGFGFQGGIGSDKTIKWKQTLASGVKEVILVKEDDLTIYLPIRGLDYNMEASTENHDYSDLNLSIIREVKEGNMKSFTAITERELFKSYNIKLLELNYNKSLIK